MVLDVIVDLMVYLVLAFLFQYILYKKLYQYLPILAFSIEMIFPTPCLDKQHNL